MMSAIVQTARPQASEDPARHEIPPSVLVIGKKHAGEYIAPALFRLNSEGRLEIRARGSLSIVTAVDVAELVRRNVGHLVVSSITVGTNEVVIDGVIKRMSTIEIVISKELPQLAASQPVTQAQIEVSIPEQHVDPIVVEEEPALIVSKILAEPATPKKKRASRTKKTVKKKATKHKAKSSSE